MTKVLAKKIKFWLLSHSSELKNRSDYFVTFMTHAQGTPISIQIQKFRAKCGKSSKRDPRKDLNYFSINFRCFFGSELKRNFTQKPAFTHH
jgi:hypothetical protein